MDIDAEKLISLVEARPALYNFTIKEHHNRELIDKLWLEISEEIGAEVTDCKQKWNSLRNSYTRYLREEKKFPSGSGASKRKKWYLADYLTFLKDFVGQHKKLVSNLTIEEDVEETQLSETVNEDTDNTDSPLTNEVPDTPCSSKSSVTGVAPTKSISKRKSSALEAVTEPMINFLKSRTIQNQAPSSISPIAKFLDSLVPDVEKLNSKRQRLFKTKVLDILNILMDEEEAETENYQILSRPASSLSTSSSQVYTLENIGENSNLSPHMINYINYNTSN